MQEEKQRKRIVWLDIAKGIAILCTIVAHSLEAGPVKSFFYSFHMPLFFVLAGYTLHPAAPGSMGRLVRKDFRRLYIPVIVIFLVDTLIQILFYDVSLWSGVQIIVQRLAWGNMYHVLPDGKELLGVSFLWFLVALFWCRWTYRICLQKVPRDRPIFLLMLSLASIWVARVVWLPQCVDLIPLGMLFMEGGYQLRQSGKEDAPLARMAGVAGFFVWIYLTGTQGVTIDLGLRSYPQSMLSVLVAFVGSWVVIRFSKSLESLKTSAFLRWVGRNSLDLLCIHYLDRYWKLWDRLTFAPESSLAFCNIYLLAAYRVVMDLILLFLWLYIKKKGIALWQRRKKKLQTVG